MARYKYLDNVSADPKPGAIPNTSGKHNTSYDCSHLPQITDEEAAAMAYQNRVTPIIVIRQHEIAALIRRKALESTRDTAIDTPTKD